MTIISQIDDLLQLEVSLLTFPTKNILLSSKFFNLGKPGPDELDHYLEERGFYRKHVARMSST